MRKFPLLLLLLTTLFSLAVYAQQTPTAQSLFDSGFGFLGEKRYIQAIAAFEESARLDPTEPATYANLGSAYLAVKNHAKAEAALRTAIRLKPADGEIHVELCRSLSLQKKHTEAIASCEAAVRLAPNSERVRVGMLGALQAAGRPTEEIVAFAERSLSEMRDSKLVLAGAALYYLDLGERNRAAELLQRLIALEPSNARFHALIAEVYLRSSRDEESLASARRAIAIDPADPQANFAMGLIFHELGQHEEASESFAKVRSDDPRLRYAEFYRAQSNATRGRLDEAITGLQALVTAFPDDYQFLLELGNQLNSASRHEEAVAPLRKAIELKPRDFYPYVALGLALFEAARPADAVPILNEALRLNPGNEVITMYLRVAQGRQVMFAQMDDMRKYVEENPDDLNVKLRLIQALTYGRKVGEAEPYVQDIYKRKNVDTSIFQHIAVAYVTAGDHQKAIEAYKRSLEAKENPAAYLGFAGIHSQRGEVEQATAAYAKVLEIQPNSPGIMLLFAKHLADNGKRREALDMLKRSLAIQPNNGTAIFNAGMLSGKLGERENALLYLEMLRTVDPRLARQLERCLRLRIWG
jgi:tetratricopeptide (TPR) repeat protein